MDLWPRGLHIQTICQPPRLCPPSLRETMKDLTFIQPNSRIQFHGLMKWISCSKEVDTAKTVLELELQKAALRQRLKKAQEERFGKIRWNLWTEQPLPFLWFLLQNVLWIVKHTNILDWWGSHQAGYEVLLGQIVRIRIGSTCCLISDANDTDCWQGHPWAAWCSFWSYELGIQPVRVAWMNKKDHG